MSDDTGEEVDDEEVEETEVDAAAPRPPLRDTQFRLASFFVLTAVAAVYFFLEKTYHGEFGTHALGAVILIFGVVLPVFGFIFWLLRACFSVREPWGTLLLIAIIGGAIALGLLQFSWL
jgi:hypothetical protein